MGVLILDVVCKAQGEPIEQLWSKKLLLVYISALNAYIVWTPTCNATKVTNGESS